MLSPTRYALLKREIDKELDEAKRKGDVPAVQVALAKLTALRAARHATALGERQ
jgi:hypothetical protein